MGNWYCKNCNSYEDSWAEKQFHNPTETYRRDIRCWSCDKWELTYTDSQKSRYKELVKERTNIPGYVEEVERFSTWWSNNIATAVVYYNGYYRVFLLVYDSAYNSSRPAVFPEDYDCMHWGDNQGGRKSHGNLSRAKNEASWLRGELSSGYGKYDKNPILLIHPYCDCSLSFGEFVTEPYVTKNYSTSYLKPFDVVKTDMTAFDHVGIYLGKIDGEFKVFQYTGKGGGDTKIDRWNDFLEGKVVARHPVIPFKNYKDIARQIVWAKDNNFRKNEYSLANRNCEHFANMLVYGINYSKQVEDSNLASTVDGINTFNAVPLSVGFSILNFRSASVRMIKKNNDKGSTIKLTNEINETDSILGKKSDYETKKHEEKYLQEVPPKDYCRIM